MSELPITLVVTVSVSATPTGAGLYNVNNLAVFTRDEYEPSFGDDGYKIYFSPTQVGTDFGTDSVTYAMANSIFSQTPNILAGGGYLVVIPMLEDQPAVIAVQTITFSGIAAEGSYKLNYDGDVTTDIAYNATQSDIQTAIRTLTGLGSVTVVGTTATSIVVTFTGVSGPADLLTFSDNSMQTSGPVNVVPTVTTTTVGVAANGPEPLADAITRAAGLVQFFGILATEIQTEGEMLDAAAVIQPLNKMAGFVQSDEATVETGGALDLLRSGGFTKSRGLFYGYDDDEAALVFAAGYMARGMSVDFSGSNTTINMNMKDIVGSQPDTTIDGTLYTKIKAAGADCYPSIQGIAKVMSSGRNGFFDQVYNLGAFVGDLQIAGFNALATTSTKLPQTEEGVDVLSGAYRKVCEKYKTNQYIAPGVWSSPVTFGNQADLFRNISERGYYIYSSPVALQSQEAREDRDAPLIQIGIKEAGAINKSNVLVYVNA